ncbi:hypothetical protein EON63_10290 [archaeon]|nr:MAG: hypothetical protein EON63_10290 [archaeon]
MCMCISMYVSMGMCMCICMEDGICCVCIYVYMKGYGNYMVPGLCLVYVCACVCKLRRLFNLFRCTIHYMV